MTLLPIVARELRVASRRKATHWVRISSALVALIIGGWIMLMPGLASNAVLGTSMFVGLSIFAMIYGVLAGLRTTSDCLSVEKREGTLGLLFLTDLKGYDIVFGKLVASSLNTFYGLLAMFPVMAIPLLLGGVSIDEFARVVCVCLNNLFLSLAIGMFCSAVCHSDRKSMVMCMLIVGVMTIGFPIVGGFWVAPPRNWEAGAVLFILSPGYLSFAAFDETYRMLTGQKLNYFYVSFLSLHGLSWVLIALSAYIVPRTWKDTAASPAKARRQAAFHRLQHGSEDRRALLRARRLDKNPIYWLTSRDRTKPAKVWLFLLACGLLWLWGTIKHPRDWIEEESFILTALALHTVFKLWMALEAGRQFGLDRQSGALELLLSTPISVRKILWGQLHGLAYHFLWPCLVVLGVDFIFLLTDWSDRYWFAIWVAGMLIFALDMIALALLSMWRSFRTGNPTRSGTTSIMVVMVLPWVAYFALMTGLALLDAWVVPIFRHLPNDEIVLVGLWLVIAGLFSSGAIVLSWRGLTRQFRLLSSQPTRAQRRNAMADQNDAGSQVKAQPPPMPSAE